MDKKLKTIFVIIAVILAASFTMGGYDKPVKHGKAGQSREELYNQVELFSDAISAIRSDYVDEVDSKKIIYGSMRGMLSSLDDYSSFLDPDEHKEIAVEAKGEFGGLGVEIMLKDGILTVITPIVGTPADAAGVKSGDRIVRIDGKTTKNIKLNDAVKMMRGNPGTQVILTVWREKDQRVLDIPIKRAVINIASVKDAYLIDGKIGYIRLIEFQEKAGRQFEESLKKLEGQGMDALILDLRNNPGGLLDSAIEVSEKFLPKDKVIVSTKSRAPSQNAVFKSGGQYKHPQYPVIVLVNDGSASASEIVAGSLKDNKRAIIMGTKTFGKGSVQTVIPLKDGSALRLTTALYYTPNGKSIMNDGIVPDVIVEEEEFKNKDKTGADIFERIEKDSQIKKAAKTGKPGELIERDNQLREAVNLMKAMKVYKASNQ